MPLTFLQAQDPWTLRKDQDGIKIYTRSVAGETFLEYRAETEITASPDTLLALFYQADKNPEWVHQVSLSKRLKETEKNAFYIYSVLEAPWPVKSRDMIYRCETKSIAEGYRFQMQNAPDKLPEEKGKVRIPRFYGFWEFKRLKSGKTQIIHQAFSAPGGGIPAWLANAAVVEIPFKSLENLKARFE